MVFGSWDPHKVIEPFAEKRTTVYQPPVEVASLSCTACEIWQDIGQNILIVHGVTVIGDCIGISSRSLESKKTVVPGLALIA